jgi:hypothetical protein
MICQSTPLPEIPAFTTAFTGSLDASSRRARTSGQRLLESTDPPKPSVIELPNATITPVAFALTTSIPASQIHCCSAVSACIDVAAVKSPGGET